ncbi:lytic murein transglycosylase B [Aliikangiella coralliicola]|nr:lytic murein transglycosylase B [Aliikangiella coralliicola]
MIRKKILAGISILASFPLFAADYVPLVSNQQAEKEIKAFAQDMAKKHQFDQKQIFEKLSSMQPRQDIIERISKPAESMPWHRYRKIWMKDKRINDGVAFWQQHAETLAKAEAVYGVEQSIIVGIIGVETFYGRIQGTFPVIEALHTLGFYYPKRSKFFRSELEQYYLLANEQKWELDEINGSYAGAMGMGQFISSSYRHYGVDFNQDGKINLFSDPVDMIGSVANYFSRHKWRKGGFVVQPVVLQDNQKSLVQSQLALSHSLNKFESAGINLDQVKGKSDKVGIFPFELTDGSNEHWLAGDNFYVITRYNRSSMYALAVFQLSQAISEKKNALQKSEAQLLSE